MAALIISNTRLERTLDMSLVEIRGNSDQS